MVVHCKCYFYHTEIYIFLPFTIKRYLLCTGFFSTYLYILLNILICRKKIILLNFNNCLQLQLSIVVRCYIQLQLLPYTPTDFKRKKIIRIILLLLFRNLLFSIIKINKFLNKFSQHVYMS